MLFLDSLDDDKVELFTQGGIPIHFRLDPTGLRLRDQISTGFRLRSGRQPVYGWLSTVNRLTFRSQPVFRLTKNLITRCTRTLPSDYRWLWDIPSSTKTQCSSCTKTQTDLFRIKSSQNPISTRYSEIASGYIILRVCIKL